MTYCLGIMLPCGLVLASDSRSSASVDQIMVVKKTALFQRPGERVIAILSAGNLATTQAVITMLRQSAGGLQGEGGDGHGDGQDILAARTMFDVAQIVGDVLRIVVGRNKTYVQPYGDPDATFLVGGQIAGETHRLFQIYSAGNFIEAAGRTQFFQLGETKYGKPILDRALARTSDLDEAAKLSLLSFDATIRSNLSVAPPIDMLIYEADSLSASKLITFDTENAYWKTLRDGYAAGLAQVVDSLPAPTF
ncbi:MAG: peptidase [Alsobacter sp.]